MKARQQHGDKRHGRMVGNLALAGERFNKPTSWKPRVGLRLVEQGPVEALASDPLAATKGIVIGISISMILWSLIVFSLGLISSPFVFFVAAIVLMLVAKDTEQEGLERVTARLREDSGVGHERPAILARAA